MLKIFLRLLEKLLPQHELPAIKSPFQALTPTDDAEDNKTYSQAMDFAFSDKNNKICNVAVTGL